MQAEKRKNLRIAVVEAEPVFASFIRRCLEELGFTLNGEYCTLKEAEENVIDSDVDVLIIDLFTDGIQTKDVPIGRFMLKNNIPVIFLFTIMDIESMGIIDHFDFHGVIQKPFTREDLLTSIDQVYGRYTKSLKFYRDCRGLILDINPCKIDYLNKIDSLIQILNDDEREKGNLDQLTGLLNDIKVQMQRFVISDRVAMLRNRQLKNSVSSIAKYSNCLMEEVDSLNIKDIKKYVRIINTYLRILLTSCEN